MNPDESIDLLYAMADGAARWDAARSFGEDVVSITAEHRRLVRQAVEVLIRCDWDDVDTPTGPPNPLLGER